MANSNEELKSGSVGECRFSLIDGNASCPDYRRLCQKCQGAAVTVNNRMIVLVNVFIEGSSLGMW